MLFFFFFIYESPLNIKLVVQPVSQFNFDNKDIFGCLISYPGTDGSVDDVRKVVQACRAAKGTPACVTDLLALTLLTSPADLGFEIAVGNSQVQGRQKRRRRKKKEVQRR